MPPNWRRLIVDRNSILAGSIHPFGRISRPIYTRYALENPAVRFILIFILCGAFAGIVSAQEKRSRDVVQRDGVTIEVIAEGRGPLIVLLPSLGRDSEEFDPVAGQIAAAGFRVLRPQPRGYGRSAGPLQNVTLHDYA